MMRLLTVKDIAAAIGVTPRSAQRRLVKLKVPYDQQSVLGGYKRFYRRADLPEDMREAIVAREIADCARQLSPEEIDRLPPAAPRTIEIVVGPLAGPGLARRNARLEVVRAWRDFRDHHRRGGESARRDFCLLYNHGHIALCEDSIAALTTAGGRRTMCANTLRRWEDFDDAGRWDRLAGAPRPKGQTILARAEDGAVARYIGALIVSRPHLSSDHVYDCVRGQFGKTLMVAGRPRRMPSRRSVMRFIKTWKAEHAEAFMKMTDPDGFRSKMRVRGRNMNAWVKHPNQLWEIDASPADVMLKDGRHSIYVVIDIATRRMMAEVSRTPSTRAVLGLMKRAILAWGAPKQLRTDKGSDFISFHFKSAMADAAIEHQILPPYSPWLKGTVERAIGTIQHNFMPALPGYIGHNVTERKKIEARKSFAQRRGESDENIFAVDLTSDELQAELDRWLDGKYAHRIHGGLNGKSPMLAAAESTRPIRTIEAATIDALFAPLASPDGCRTVTGSGVSVDGGWFNHARLFPGQRVRVKLDVEDMGRVFIMSADGSEFICIAICPERAGKAPSDAARALRTAQSRRIREEVEPLRRDIRRMKPRDVITMIHRSTEADHGTLVTLPPRGEAHEGGNIAAGAEAESARRGAPDEGGAETRARKSTDENFRRATEIEAALDAGLSVAEDDLAWLESYRGTPEYRSRKSIDEAFGGEDFITVYA